MGWFDAWLDPDYVPDGNPRALMRMAVKAKTTLQRRRAILWHWRMSTAAMRCLPS